MTCLVRGLHAHGPDSIYSHKKLRERNDEILYPHTDITRRFGPGRPQLQPAFSPLQLNARLLHIAARLCRSHVGSESQHHWPYNTMNAEKSHKGVEFQ